MPYLFTAMDRATPACYGWDDLEPRHGFYPNERGQVRFSVLPEARRAILQRLVDLNLALAKR